MNRNAIGVVSLICAIPVSACLLVAKAFRYFPESSFELAGDSRPPKWISIPPSPDRKKVKLTMSYYTFGSVGYTLQDEKGHQIVEVDGRGCGTFTATGSPAEPFTYPSYEAVIAKGVTEIMEHRAMEPIFRVTDDPAVWNRYSTLGCK